MGNRLAGTGAGKYASTIWLPQAAVQVIQFACIEVYPREAFGWLIGETKGHNWHVSAVVLTQLAKKRSAWAFETHDRSEQAYIQTFHDDHVIGDFHSHTNDYRTASPCDRENTEPDDCMLIVAVRPSQRGFCFNAAGYVNIDKKAASESKIRRANVRVY